MPEESLEHLSSRFQVIGSIAILSLDLELEPFKKEIAMTVLDQCRSIRTVLNKRSRLEGERRTSRLDLLAGIESTVTVHREYGFVYGLEVLSVRRCGNVAPGVSRWAFDLKKI